jgi:hypothetical protein
MEKIYKGSCLCQQVRFEVTGNFESFFLCHCKHCQKDTGSAHASNLFSTTATIKWLSGAEKVKTYNLPNTRHAKSFCMECSSSLPSLQMEGKLLVVPAGSLDTDLDMKPNAHLFCASKAAWEKDLDGITKFETFPR